MYLYYYLREKLVGTVDLDVFFDVQQAKTMVACSPDCDDLLGGLELAYGKKIPRFSRAEMWDIKHGHHSKKVTMSPHVFTTKNCGAILHWSNVDKALACKG